MSWITNIKEQEDFFMLFTPYGFYNPEDLVGVIGSDDQRSRAKLQRFTNILNGASYVLGPIIGIVRLIAAVVLAVQIASYRTNFNEAEEKAAAKKYVVGMVVRGLVDFLGPLAAIVDGIATFKKMVN